MKEITLDEMKKLELDMLIDFANFCDKNGYRYYLCGGTLLGAIRHKGFIPWDDDIDIFMPRPDYEKALKSYRHNYYQAEGLPVNLMSKARFTRMYDRRTLMIETHLKEKDISIFNDVFPIDGLPSIKCYQKLVYYIEQILIACYLATIMKFSVSLRYKDLDAGFANWRKYVRTTIKFILIIFLGWTSSNFWARLINKVAMRWSFEECNEVACVVCGHYGSRETLPKSVFDDCIQVEFEGHKFWAPKGYDIYLRNLYGDYMQLPPEDKRVSHHDFKAYWKDGFGE